MDGEMLDKRLIALSCSGLSLVFPIFEETGVWQLVFGQSGGSRGIPILDRVSLQIPKGKFVGILGRNGAGKTSLLRALGGIYPATSGSVECSDEPIDLFDLGVFGNRRLTGREYAERFLSIQGTSKHNRLDVLAEILDFSELSDRIDDPIFTYSSGMLARLYFAAATATPCAMYLIDEFLMVGDEYFQAKCWRRLRERMAEGTAGVLVTHDWTTILSLCEEAHLMHQGRIVRSGSSERIVREYLNLPTPERTDIASFMPDLSQEYHARTGEDAELVFRVNVKQDVPVVLSYSIEMLQPGKTWNILLMGENLPIASNAGLFDVRLHIPRFPLAPGRYLLNVFLSALQPDATGSQALACDVRGWTYGNALSVIVDGALSRCVTSIPIDWIPESLAS